MTREEMARTGPRVHKGLQVVAVAGGEIETAGVNGDMGVYDPGRNKDFAHLRAVGFTAREMEYMKQHKLIAATNDAETRFGITGHGLDFVVTDGELPASCSGGS